MGRKTVHYINMEHKLRDGRGFRSVKIVVLLLKDSKVSSSGMAALRETRSTGTGEYLYPETWLFLAVVRIHCYPGKVIYT